MKSFALRIRPSKIEGSIAIPSSKSQSLRAILFASLANGKSTISGVLPSMDIEHMITACRIMGATIDREEACLSIVGVSGKVESFSDVVNAGNSGIILRFLSAVASLSSSPFVITGDSSIRYRRPMEDMMVALKRGNVDVKSLKGDAFAPLIIQGPLKEKDIFLKGGDSQPVSAFLIAAACRDVETDLHIENPGEKPWILLTLEWLLELGVPFKASADLKLIQVFGQGGFQSFDYRVPGDLSSLAFPLIAALICRSSISIKNVNLEDAQGDKKLIEILKIWGADISFNSTSNTLLVDGRAKLKSGEVDIKECIDALPALAALSCFIEGTTIIRGVSGARDKESDRVEAMHKELTAMGANIKIENDSMIIKKSALNGAILKSHRDHRVIMALSIAALAAKGETYIEDVSWINKTYPSFVEDFVALGANMELI